jgi:hypothetical protein
MIRYDLSMPPMFQPSVCNTRAAGLQSVAGPAKCYTKPG